jgi:signal transduction histidine kinase
MPAAPGDEPPAAGAVLRSFLPGARRRGGPRRRDLLAYVVIGAAVSSVLGAAGVGLGRGSAAPLTLAGLGALLIWWRTPAGRRQQWSRDARHYGSWLTRRGPLLVVLGGAGMVIAGVASFLAANDAIAQAKAGALAIGATLVGTLLITAPWSLRLLRELTEERRARIREHERAELAAHVHDSVLQTLALIQADAADPDAVRRLARSQERELRSWLYQAATASPGGLAALLREISADVEDAYGVTVEVVVVGDAPLDDGLRAVAAAAREALVNAAKSSGAALVSVFAEVSRDGAEVYVRDRGRGFDPERVPDDRHGIRDSIVGRMQRHGGAAVIRTGPDGTEVTLSLTRKARV